MINFYLFYNFFIKYYFILIKYKMKDILIHSNDKNINFSLKKLQNNNINNDDLLIGIYEDKYSINDKKSKKLVSKLEYNLFILYDIQSENIFLINKKDIINRVISFNYRFPDLFLIETLKYKLKKLTNQTNSIKINKIFNFLKNFDINILEKNFIKEFEKINNSKYKEYTTCLRQSYTNILPNTYYIKPYFNLSELEKNYINNSDLDDNNTKNNTNTDLDEYDLCNKTLLRDIPISTLNLHQQYINYNSSTSVIQYYSLIGSYIINNYLRELTENSKYKNIVIENLIKKLWSTIINAPSFDENFYIYRFLNNDDFLKKIEIGDIYTDDGFLSTTRDPFYISKYYSFGNKLMKIKVPKNQKGMGLCLELFSHFGREQEILLAPKTKLKLVKKDKDVKYEHVNYDITIKLESKYEFEIIEICDVEIKKKIDVNINKIDKIDKIDNLESNTLEDIYNNIKEKYLNENNQVMYKIGNEYINLIIDKNIIYESYYIKPFYVGSDEQSTETVLIYHIKDNEIIFFIEINYNKETQENEINVNINNYYNYSNILTEDIFETKDFLLFLKNLSEVFNNNSNNIPEIQILCDFISCNIFKDKKIDKLVDDYRDILSGNSNLEIYNYFKEDKIRFQDYILNNIIVPYFDYNKLDKYKKIKITDIIDEIESNELKEIINSYINNNNKQYYNVSTFYIYLVENYCFLVSELIYSLANYEYNNFKDYDRSIFYNPYYVFFPNNLTSK